MPLKLQKRVVDLVQEILSAELSTTPDWLVRPGRLECGPEWSRISQIYAALTGATLPDVMRPVERRTVDAVLLLPRRAPMILEVDERQHFNEFRALTLRNYPDVPVAFDRNAWMAASLAKRKLEGVGFAKPRAPLFPAVNGRHRQRAFRDALCDILPPVHAFAPTLRIADFEVAKWIFQPRAAEHMQNLLTARLAG